MKIFKKRHLGPVEKKILILLAAGASLALTRRPDQYFRIIDLAAEEWKKVNRKSLYEAIRKLYQSQMIGYKEKSDGTIVMTLAKDGRERVLEYNLETMELKKPATWDGSWRIIIFDIPEYKKKARDAFSQKMKQLGLKPLQKSVFVYPYDCRSEIDFITEIFDVRPFVRYIIARDIDIALHLKYKFNLA